MSITVLIRRVVKQDRIEDFLRNYASGQRNHRGFIAEILTQIGDLEALPAPLKNLDLRGKEGVTFLNIGFWESREDFEAAFNPKISHDDFELEDRQRLVLEKMQQYGALLPEARLSDSLKKLDAAVKRGDVVSVDLSGSVGAEKHNDQSSKRRPCVVIQNNTGNDVSPLTIVVPLTDAKQFKNLPVQVKVSASEIEMKNSKDSVIECGHVRSIDTKSRIFEKLGTIQRDAMARVDIALMRSMGLGG